MESLFELGVSCFGHELYYKAEIEDAEYAKKTIVSCVRDTVAVPRTAQDYRDRAKKVLNG